MNPVTVAAVAGMTRAALAFQAALAPPQRPAVCFEFTHPQRTRWHYVPKVRAGLAVKDMTPPQRAAALALLKSALSATGFEHATAIMALEAVLRDLEGGNPGRDPERYYVAVFGTPGGRDPWGWRVEGHHLSVNLTVVGEALVAGVPLFFGANPARVPAGPKAGLRILAAEEDLGRGLLLALDSPQRRAAILSDTAPGEILTGADPAITRETPAGLAAERMKAAQRDALKRLVETYARRLRSEIADSDLNEIERAGWDRVHFAWAGSPKPGQGHYYRVQGPTFLIEYDNTQNDANHIHAVWRGYDRDFGADLLREHHRRDHRPSEGPRGR